MDFSFFFSNSTFVLGTAATLHPNPHACRKISMQLMIFVCVHVQIGTQAWEHFTARDRAQLTTVKRFTVGRKTNGVLCSIVYRPPSRPPPSPLRSPFPLRSRLKIYVGHVDKSL